MPPKTSRNVADVDVDDLIKQIIVKINDGSVVIDAITRLKNDITTLRGELKKKDDEIQFLKIKCDDLEQYGRRNNVRISGIVEDENEDIEEVVMNDISDRLGVEVTSADIDRCHRVGREAPAGKHRPILVKFTNYGARRRVFQAKKKLKGTGVSIHEDLTKTRVELLKKSIEKYTMKEVWTTDGTIIIKNGNNRLRVSNGNDLEQVIRDFPPRNPRGGGGRNKHQ